jgi:transcriptional regulator with XRE-family HTH domain
MTVPQSALLKHRKALGVTQAHLAQRAHIAQADIVSFENGRRLPRMDVMPDGRLKIPDEPDVALMPDDMKRDYLKRKRREEKAETKEYQDQLGAERSPTRRGLVSGAWIDQQVESFVKARGHIFQDGPVRVVVMSRPDVLALCKLMLEVGAVRVE